jgi:predicted nuclease with RNAse H fold
VRIGDRDAVLAGQAVVTMQIPNGPSTGRGRRGKFRVPTAMAWMWIGEPG